LRPITQGYGHSDWPDPKQFDYTFDHIASVMDHFTERLALSHYTLYMQAYGGPVAFRMALAHPERVEALILLDAVAHNEGLERTGQLAARSGQTVPHMRRPCEKIFFRLKQKRRAHVGDDPNIELRLAAARTGSRHRFQLSALCNVLGWSALDLSNFREPDNAPEQSGFFE
jgi:pimeloyl-ACP methyl ester carboxylesterase